MKSVKIQIPEGYEIDEQKSSFEEIVFKKIEKKLPTCYEELPNVYDSYYLSGSGNIKKDSFFSCYDNNKNHVRTEDQAKSIQVLPKLLQLRDEYRQGWTPDWGNFKIKFCLCSYDNTIIVDENTCCQQTFVFQTKELAEQFLQCFKNDLEIYFKGLV